MPAAYGTTGAVYDDRYNDLYTNTWYGYQNYTTVPTLPFAANVPESLFGMFYGQGNVPAMVPSVPVSLNGSDYRWISPTADASALFGSPYNESNYTWIVAQSFNVAEGGLYDFNFQASGDNAVSFFIDGTISTALMSGSAGDAFQAYNGYYPDSVHPTIIDGIQLVSAENLNGYYNNFSDLGTFTGTANLTPGTHTAFMVLHDLGGLTTAFINEGSFAPSSSAIPEPGNSLSVAGLLAAGLAIRRRR